MQGHALSLVAEFLLRLMYWLRFIFDSGFYSAAELGQVGCLISMDFS